MVIGYQVGMLNFTEYSYLLLATRALIYYKPWRCDILRDICVIQISFPKGSFFAFWRKDHSADNELWCEEITGVRIFFKPP